MRRVAVDDGGAAVVVAAGSPLDGAPSGGGAVCPFDNLLWDRAFVRRLFGFDHLIEVYKRPHERVYGYYVLPLLLGDRLVGARRPQGRDGAAGCSGCKRFTPSPRCADRSRAALERAPPLDWPARSAWRESSSD